MLNVINIPGEIMKRSITETEKYLVKRMAETLPQNQRDQILGDLEASTVESLNDDSSIIRFDIEGYSHPSAIGRHKLAEGFTKDSDGARIEVLLFSDNNHRLYEFEIVRYAEGEITGPDWTTLEFY